MTRKHRECIECIEQILKGPFYAHLGKASLVIWSNKGKVALPVRSRYRQIILRHENRLPEPHLEKAVKKSYPMRYTLRRP